MYDCCELAVMKGLQLLCNIWKVFAVEAAFHAAVLTLYT